MGNASSFLIFKAKAAFNCLRLAFIKAPILWHFYLECHIQIKTDTLDYAISGVLNQLAFGIRSDKLAIKTNLGQWYPIALFLKKMIPAEIRYKSYNDKFLAIVEVFKTWHHYLKGCKHEDFILTDHKNLCWFIDMMNLNSRQVC